MGRDSLYVVAYDVAEDAERLKVAKILQGFGSRVQKSVFECRLSDAMRRRLVTRLEALELTTGGVRLYRLSQHDRTITVGECPGVCEEEPFAYVL